ncbi:Phenolic acid decarboxylase, bacterial [Ceraceosorus bombacis]|uniref:Phenolic acid decarboxylase, bacterial n=1 Tax=Ceraceosorus bombacis TaxID=401625 RepID=A0A0P1BE00_9BASI|nr:Phenolic acid decarboxylase, bacterial [Ceraceosorus bombacis]
MSQKQNEGSKQDLSGLINKHLLYTYDNGWKYESWIKSPTRIVYKIHGGPMGGRDNYQTISCRVVREPSKETGEQGVYLISWLEETGTVVSMTIDFTNNKVNSFICFSKGHWENPQIAHGHYKKEQWRQLAKVPGGESITTDRTIISESATLSEVTEGRGELEDVAEDAPTL